MKIHRTQQLIRGLATLVGGFALFTGALQAAPFLYAPGDLVLAFRQTGNASDYVVNIGKATDYSVLPPGSTVIINNLSVAQFSSAFPSINGLKWSVAAANRPPLVPNFPVQTLWVTAPRANADLQSNPWLRKPQAVQGNTGSQVDGVGVNAALSSSLLPAGSDNTATGVVIPVNAPFAIGPVLGIDGDYVGNFQGIVENLTPDDFDGDASNVSRSDLYEVVPGTRAGGTLDTPGRHLGYFELKPDGTLSFNNPVPTPPRPTITNIGRTGEVTTVSFNTVAGVTYRLRYTDAAGLTSPLSTWSTGASISGTGSVLSLDDTHADPVRFYVVEAQP